MTVLFLGRPPAQPAAALDELCAAASGVVAESFDLSIDRAGSFANAEVPWWLGCGNIPAALVELRRALVGALPPEFKRHADLQPFVPHVTIMRDVGRPLVATGIEPIRWPVREFVLLDSRRQPVPEYRQLGRWPLAGDAAAAGTPR